MERKPRQPREGKRVERIAIDKDENGIEWLRANGCYIEVAEGFLVEKDGTKSKSFRVGLHLLDGRKPIARMAMDADSAISLATSLISYSASVDHLVKYHPTGNREHCTFESTKPTEAEVEQLVDRSLGPLERGMSRARQLTNEVASALAAMQTLALEEGLFIPDGQHVEMDDEKEEHIAQRVDRLMRLMSPEARRVLVHILYLTGDEAMADFLGRAVYEPSSTTTH